MYIQSSLSAGFSLLELTLAVVVAGLLAAIAVPSYRAILAGQDVERAIRDIREIEQQLERFRTVNQRFPQTLAEAGLAGRSDPWGNAYRYVNVQTAPNRGVLRKDRNLVPINSDYDLYSVGKDGDSRTPLTARASRDDVVRASNGGYIGLAKDY